MSRFTRPSGAIDNFADLKVGDVIWHVYGIWPPFMSTSPATVVEVARPYSLHRDYSDDSTQGDLMVFDVLWREDFTDMHFASDGNLVPGKSHNDNYWFRTEDEAKVAVEFLRNQWDADPNSIAEVLADRELLRSMDDYYDAYGYDEAA